MIIYAPGTSRPGTRERALALVGTRFDPGWCLHFQTTEIFRVPRLASYDFTGTTAAAYDYWAAASLRGLVVETDDPADIPAGAMIAWVCDGRYPGDYGHVAYALGDGEMVSTDLPDRGFVGRLPVSEVPEEWGMTLAGYILKDGNGFTLIKPSGEDS